MTSIVQTDYRADRRMARGTVCSLFLHGLVLLTLLYAPLPAPAPAPPKLPNPVPVDLVTLADETRAPSAARQASVPQQRAAETALHPSPRAVPEPKKASAAATAPGDLASRLEALAHLPQPPAAEPPSPRPQEGTGISNVTAGNADAFGRNASYGIKDYLRAQIEKRWFMQKKAMTRNDWVVHIHLTLTAEGTVDRADILDDPRYQDDADFRDFAHSARNAILLSSPLSLPPGLPASARDLVLDFNPRQVQQ